MVFRTFSTRAGSHQMPLLAITDLQVHFIRRGLDNRVKLASALNGVNLSLEPGEIVGLVGETGAGKSLTAYAVIGLLRGAARIVGGSVRFDGLELVGMPDAALSKIRGNRLSVVVQNPKSSLDPLMRIGDQMARIRQAHHGGSRADADRRALALLEQVGIPDPASRMKAWPHEFSGGMAQRVAIAMALINDPALLIADEPTTGLDVTVQAHILDLLRELVRARGMAALIITHDLGVVAQYCDRVAVMFGGRVVETGAVRMLVRPIHPYSRALVAATPERRGLGRDSALGGAAPNLAALPSGCHYRPRCPLATPICTTMPPLLTPLTGRSVLCHRADMLVHETWP